MTRQKEALRFALDHVLPHLVGATGRGTRIVSQLADLGLDANQTMRIIRRHVDSGDLPDIDYAEILRKRLLPSMGDDDLINQMQLDDAIESAARYGRPRPRRPQPVQSQPANPASAPASKSTGPTQQTTTDKTGPQPGEYFNPSSHHAPFRVDPEVHAFKGQPGTYERLRRRPNPIVGSSRDLLAKAIDRLKQYPVHAAATSGAATIGGVIGMDWSNPSAHSNMRPSSFGTATPATVTAPLPDTPPGSQLSLPQSKITDAINQGKSYLSQMSNGLDRGHYAAMGAGLLGGYGISRLLRRRDEEKKANEDNWTADNVLAGGAGGLLAASGVSRLKDVLKDYVAMGKSISRMEANPDGFGLDDYKPQHGDIILKGDFGPVSSPSVEPGKGVVNNAKNTLRRWLHEASGGSFVQFGTKDPTYMHGEIVGSAKPDEIVPRNYQLGTADPSGIIVDRSGQVSDARGYGYRHNPRRYAVIKTLLDSPELLLNPSAFYKKWRHNAAKADSVRPVSTDRGMRQYSGFDPDSLVAELNTSGTHSGGAIQGVDGRQRDIRRKPMTVLRPEVPLTEEEHLRLAKNTGKALGIDADDAAEGAAAVGNYFGLGTPGSDPSVCTGGACAFYDGVREMPPPDTALGADVASTPGFKTVAQSPVDPYYVDRLKKMRKWMPLTRGLPGIALSAAGTAGLGYAATQGKPFLTNNLSRSETANVNNKYFGATYK